MLFQEHLSLLEITCAYQLADRTLGIQTDQRSRRLQPLQITFTSDSDLEEWHAEIVNGMNSVRCLRGAPSVPGSVFSVTSRGEVVVFDPKAVTAEQQAAVMQENNGAKNMDGQFSQVTMIRFMK